MLIFRTSNIRSKKWHGWWPIPVSVWHR